MLLKSIVLGLALANVGYFLWAHGIAQPRDAAVPVQTLKLASEATRTAGGAGEGAHDIVGATGAGAAGTAAEAGAPPGAAATGTSTGSAGAGAATTGAAIAETAAAGTAVTDTPAAGAAAGAPELLTNVKRCLTIGPFHDVSAAAHAASTLRGGHYDPRQRVVDGEVWSGVWVYLPVPSRAVNEQMLAKLKGAGIDDAMEMPGPSEGSVISLGLFSDQKRAQSRVAQAQALGFNPAVADRKRTGNVYWIDVDLKPTDALLNPADLQGETGRISRLEVKACPAAVQP